MHLFMRTIGFAELNGKQEDKLIKTAVKTAVANQQLLECKTFKRAIIPVHISERTGIYIYGQFDGKKFKTEYYYPYLKGTTESDNEEISMERHVDKESFEVVCEEIKAGVTLIFYLQNPVDYLLFREQIPSNDPAYFSLNRKNLAEKEGIAGKKVTLAGLSVGGMILLPAAKKKTIANSQKLRQEMARKNLIAAAKEGNQDAIESLTIEDLDIYTSLSRRIVNEDVFSIVESTFMPCGVECDQYSIMGEIIELSKEENVITEEQMYIMKLECNDLIFDVAVNEADVVGEPAVGRRFKGNVWLQGSVNFAK